MPAFGFDPQINVSDPSFTFKLKIVGPAAGNVKGKVRILKGGGIFMSESELEKTVLATDFIADWKVEGVSTGVVDIALIAFDSGNNVFSRDQVRISCSPVFPKSGDIHLVNSNNELDVSANDFQAFDTIAAALAIAGPSDTVAIARGTYIESGLNVKSDILVVGLGGKFTHDPNPVFPFELNHYPFQHVNLPIIKGNSSDVVASLENLTLTEIAAVEIRDGNSSSGSGMRINNCSQVRVYLSVFQNNVSLGINSYGGAIFINNSTLVTVESNKLINNMCESGGAGIFVRDSTVTINDNTIENNNIQPFYASNVNTDFSFPIPRSRSVRYGGGIGCQGTNLFGLSGEVTIKNNLIQGNRAEWAGGGIGIVGSVDSQLSILALTPDQKFVTPKGGINSTIEHNLITHNDLPDHGFGEERGGGIYNGAFWSELTLKDNQILFNKAGDGGGICGFGLSQIYGDDNKIKDNIAFDDAGGINHGGASVGTWQNCQITNNTAKSNGGGVHCSILGNFKFMQCMFVNNKAVNRGGAISGRDSKFISMGNNLIKDNTAGSHGGGILVRIGTPPHDDPRFPASLTLVNGDIVDHNKSLGGHGGGIASFDNEEEFDVRINIQDTIIRNNIASSMINGIKTAGFYIEDNYDFVIKNNSFSNNEGAGLSGEALTNPGTIEGNFFTQNDVGLNLNSSEVDVKNNIFSANQLIHLNLVDVVEISVTGNNFLHLNVTPIAINIDTSNYDTKLKINNNNFIGHNFSNSSFAIDIMNPVQENSIDAKFNWWNDTGGPHDPFNPSWGGGIDGQYNDNEPGDRVVDWVDYTLEDPPPSGPY